MNQGQTEFREILSEDNFGLISYTAMLMPTHELHGHPRILSGAYCKFSGGPCLNCRHKLDWKLLNGISSLSSSWRIKTLKRECCHFDEIPVISCTESYHKGNFLCSQWRKFRQNYMSVSVGQPCWLKLWFGVYDTSHRLCIWFWYVIFYCSCNIRSLGMVPCGSFIPTSFGVALLVVG